MAEEYTREGDFGNEYAAKIQDIHEDFKVEILEIGLLSDNSCRVVLKGEESAVNELLTEVDDPRNPPEEKIN